MLKVLHRQATPTAVLQQERCLRRTHGHRRKVAPRLRFHQAPDPTALQLAVGGDLIAHAMVPDVARGEVRQVGPVIADAMNHSERTPLIEEAPCRKFRMQAEVVGESDQLILLQAELRTRRVVAVITMRDDGVESVVPSVEKQEHQAPVFRSARHAPSQVRHDQGSGAGGDGRAQEFASGQAHDRWYSGRHRMA